MRKLQEIFSSNSMVTEKAKLYQISLPAGTACVLNELSKELKISSTDLIRRAVNALIGSRYLKKCISSLPLDKIEILADLNKLDKDLEFLFRDVEYLQNLYKELFKFKKEIGDFKKQSILKISKKLRGK